MGILKFKLADNYDYGPVDAAQNYLEKNKTVTIDLPKVENWELLDSYNYSQGFAVAGLTPATATAPGGWIGFSVCFLLNQTTGVWPSTEKSLEVIEKNGEITNRQLELLQDGLINLNQDSKMTPQVYLDSAKHMRAVMNKLNQSDDSNAQFVYEWDLSSIPNLESSKVAIAYAGLADYPQGAKAPVGAGQSTNFDFPAGVERPGYYGSVNVWEDGSATSFYGLEVVLERAEEKDEIEESLGEYINNCNQDQIELIEKLREQISGPEEEAKKKK
jgi:hypothetical protein